MKVASSFVPVLGLFSVLDVAVGAVIPSSSSSGVTSDFNFDEPTTTVVSTSSMTDTVITTMTRSTPSMTDTIITTHMPIPFTYSTTHVSMIPPFMTGCSSDMTMSILPIPTNSTNGSYTPFSMHPTPIIPLGARSITPSQAVVPPIGNAPEILTNLTHVMGIRIAALQPHDNSGKSTKLHDMCSKMSTDDCARLKEAFPGSAVNDPGFPGFECPVLHQGLCQNGDFSDSASVESEIEASLSYIFASQFQAGGGLWEGRDDVGNKPNAEKFIKFNAFVCQHLRAQNINAMGMDSKIITDAICASGQSTNLFGLAYGTLSPGMKDAIDRATTTVLGLEYQLLGKENDNTTFPLRCDSAVYTALEQQGLGNNRADFDNYYCQPAWTSPRLSGGDGGAQLETFLTELFIAQSKAALWADQANIGESAFKFLCENVDTNGLSSAYINGAVVKKAWCDIGA